MFTFLLGFFRRHPLGATYIVTLSRTLNCIYVPPIGAQNEGVLLNESMVRDLDGGGGSGED